MIGVCKRTHQTNRALQLFSQLKLHFLPDLISYNSVLAALSQDGLVKESSAILDEMLRAGIQPDHKSICAMLSGYKENWRGALSHLNLFEQNKSGAQPDLGCYTTVLAACVQAGRIEEGLQLVTRIRNRHFELDLISQNAIISAHAQAGQLLDAEKLSKEMVKRDAFTYSALLGGYRQHWEQALDVLERMREDKVAPTVEILNLIMHSCSRAGQPEHAMNILASTFDEYGLRPTTVTYGAAINACLVGFQWELALEYIESMKRDQLEPGIDIYCAIMQVLTSSGQFEEASGILKALEDGSGGRAAPVAECYPVFRIFIEACYHEYSGDPSKLKFLSMATSTNNDVIRLHLCPVAARATTVVNGEMIDFNNAQHGSKVDDSAMLYNRVTFESPYTIQVRALPADFQQRRSVTSSLRNRMFLVHNHNNTAVLWINNRNLFAAMRRKGL